MRFLLVFVVALLAGCANPPFGKLVQLECSGEVYPEKLSDRLWTFNSIDCHCRRVDNGRQSVERFYNRDICPRTTSVHEKSD